MKKTITIAALFITSISICGAQDDASVDSRGKVHLGAKAGVNYANVYDSQGEDFTADGKVGFAGGIFLSIPIGRIIGVQPEILYSQKGFQGKGKILGADYNFKRTTSYLDIPLYFAVKPAQFLTILGGPQFSYLLSRQDVFATATTSIAQEQEFQNDDIRKNTLGISIGADINIGHFVIGARANWDLQQNNSNGTSNTPRYKNQWLQATVGLRF